MILGQIILFAYGLVAALIFTLAACSLAVEVVSRMTGGGGDFDDEELALVKRGLLFFWAWPIIAAPYVIDIFKDPGEGK